MKKLLGILGTITIAGSGMVGLVGNAPAPAKNEINYSQTNDSENTNNYSWWDIISVLGKIGIKKFEEAKDYLLEKAENLKNGLENLSSDDIYKIWKNSINSLENKILDLENKNREVKVSYEINNNKIIINMNVHDENNYNGYFTNDVSTTVMGWGILDYSKFAKSWKDFTNKYKEMIIYGKATTHLLDGNHNTNDSFTIPLKDIPNTNTPLSYDWIKSRVTSGLFTHQDINLFFVVWFNNNKPNIFCFGINKEVSSLFSSQRLWYKYDIEKIIFQ